MDVFSGDTRVVHPGGFRGGTLRVPGDKSISHRVALIAGLSRGVSEVRGFLEAEDCLNTLKAMEAFGARVWMEEDAEGAVLKIEGTGGKMIEPVGALDVGNSGTGMRLLAGLCAGNAIRVRLMGDESLSGRPMGRIQAPLAQMGADVTLAEGGTPPMEIRGGGLRNIEYCLPVASAQVKSCCLLAGLYAEGETTVVEPVPTRDHTERILRATGADIRVEGHRISVRGYGAQGPRLLARKYGVPGDFSSAAYFLAAAAAISGVAVRVEALGLNPRRTAFLDVLRAMGAKVEVEPETGADADWEPRGAVTVSGAELRGVEVGGEEIIPNLIDELPLVAVLGALARGRTVIRDAAELRVKESDRIAAMVGNLQAMGVLARATSDGLVVEGPARISPVGTLRTYGDHRVAMSMSILSIFADCPVAVPRVSCVSTSYPTFWGQLQNLGVHVE